MSFGIDVNILLYASDAPWNHSERIALLLDFGAW